jgi:hypothetical protein
MIFHNINQNSDEWHQLRAGKITSSALSKAMANFGKAFGEPAKKYAVSIAIEQITGQAISSDYSNEHMERGHEEEPIARMLYEEEYFCDVANGGFFDLGDVGCSPDGLVGYSGVIEIKSAIPSVHFERVKKNKYDSAYKWQLAGNLKFTGREWIDFISYCGQFPEGKKLFIHRSTVDDFKDEFKMIDERLDQFRTLIEETKQIINQ